MEYHIVLSTNMEHDLRRMAVAVRSVASHCQKSHRLHIHIILNSSLMDKIPLLQESWADQELTLSFHAIGEVIGEREHDLDYGYWYRIWLERFLPEALERVLYLDCDIIAKSDITELWQLNLEDQALAAVWDPGYCLWDCRAHLAEHASRCCFNYSGRHPYFNSGVLFINLPCWRRLQVPEKLEANFGANRKWARWHDQDELNLLLEGQVLALSPSWNLVEYVKLFEEWDYSIYEAFGEPTDYFVAKIRHFAGDSKPDGTLARWSHKRLYYQYLDQTAWKDWRSDWDKTWFSSPAAKLLEFHYLLCRGLRQGHIRNLRRRLWSLLLGAPYILPLYLLVPLNRAYLKIREKLS